MNVLISPEMPSPALPSFILRQAAGVQVGVLWDKQHSTHIMSERAHWGYEKDVKFDVDQANIEQDTAIQKLETWERDVCFGLSNTSSGCP